MIGQVYLIAICKTYQGGGFLRLRHWMSAARMDVRTVLNALRADASGCSAAALVDLETNMVLVNDCEHTIPQEQWDHLATTASHLLTSHWSRELAGILDGKHSLQRVVLRRSDVLQLFVRSMEEPPMAMLFVCSEATETDALAHASTLALERIANDS